RTRRAALCRLCTGKRLIPDLALYLTDFVESTFVGEIAKNRDFRGGKIKKPAPIYYTSVNHAVRYGGRYALLVVRNPPSGRATGGNPSMEKPSCRGFPTDFPLEPVAHRRQ
ncbi:MAG: hypothetical protein WAM63_08405, partial [Rhodomicrobium sp.]